MRQPMDRAADPMLSQAERLHRERVVLIALKRQRELDCANRRTKDTIIGRWAFRRGSRVRLR